MADFLHCHVEDDPSPLCDHLGFPRGQPLLDTAFEAEGGIQVRAQDIVLQLGSLRKEVDQVFAGLGIRNRWHDRWLGFWFASDGAPMRNSISAEERLGKEPPCLRLKLQHKRCQSWALLVLQCSVSAHAAFWLSAASASSVRS